jgi:hypothetical protein
MTSYEDWLLQVKMKTSYTSEHPLLERKKERKKEKRHFYAHIHKRADHRTQNQGKLGQKITRCGT